MSTGGRWWSGVAPAIALIAVVLVAASPAAAQFSSAPLAPPTPQFAPSGTQASPPSLSLLPQGSARAMPQPGPPAVAGGQASLALSARFGRDAAQPISAGVLWRVYPARPDPGKPLRPIKEDKTATPVFTLPSGDYVVNASFGLASLTKNVSLRTDPVREVFDLPAGGIRLEGRVADVRIPPGQISFDVYQGSQFEQGDKQPIAHNVITGDVVVVPEGTYSIVSNYGDTNAVVRSDIRVQAGKLTDVSISHRAAVIMLKLVTSSGGEALANTEWSVLTPGGDVIKESIGAFPKVVLAEGEYRAIARNEGRTYERSFRVTTGVDGEIEVLAR